MVERGGNFESFERRPRRHPEVLSGQEELLEYLRDPENLAELVNFWEYLQSIEALIPATLPRRERETLEQQVHTEVTGLGDVGLPTPTTRVFHIGEHMDVTVGYLASAQWPDRRKPSLTLDDGTVVRPATEVGIIDYYRNIGRLSSTGNIVEFSRSLIDSAVDSLGELAREYQAFGRSARSIEVFTGMSHLARMAGRFGFTVFDIADQGKRDRATRTSFSIAENVASGNENWKRLREKYKPAKIAMISSDKLVNEFS